MSHRSEERAVEGIFHYLHSGAEPSLFRNGKVYARRDEDGNDAGFGGCDREAVKVTVKNARLLSATDEKTCDVNGFELIDAPFNKHHDFFDHEKVVRNYYAECEELVSQYTGGNVFAFDHNVRSASGKESKARIRGGQNVQGPAKMVHADYTLTSAPARLQDLSKPAKGNDTYRARLPEKSSLISHELVESCLDEGRRYAIINLWRSIAAEPVQTNPLAMCDSQTVELGDLVTFEIHYQDRIGENYFSRPSTGHQFYYYPEMIRDEALLLKQWDSAGTFASTGGTDADSSRPGKPCTFSFHTAFDPVDTLEGAPDRLSIEVRCAVFFS